MQNVKCKVPHLLEKWAGWVYRLTACHAPHSASSIVTACTFAFCLCLSPSAFRHAAAARSRSWPSRLLLSGKYAEAAEIYAPLAAKDATAAVGLAHCPEAQARREEAPRARRTGSPASRVEAELARLALHKAT